MTLAEAKVIVEGLIFAAERPLSAQEIAEIIELDPATVEALVEEIRKDYGPRALTIRMVAGGYQLVTKPELAPWIEKLGRPVIHAPLSTAATETLAIIAYEQPDRKSVV